MAHSHPDSPDTIFMDSTNGRDASKVSTPIFANSTVGFFQTPPHVPNQFLDDAAYQRAFHLFLPSKITTHITADLQSFGDRVISNQVLTWIAEAERNPPFLRTWDTWGRRKDELVTSEGWRELQEMGLREGVVAIGYDRAYGQYARLYQFFKTCLWEASSACVTCPSAMQDGAASLLLRHVQDSSGTDEATKEILREALARLTSRDPRNAWTSGQWMTERPGGSDIRNTETVATFDPGHPSLSIQHASDGSRLGPWRIDGFKWFSSATDSNMTILLAKTSESSNVSAFFAPVRRTPSPDGQNNDARASLELNGIQIQRLKSKLGTRALPTAELVLSNTRAHLIGRLGEGVKEISSILNITRLHCAIAAVGCWGRGLAVARAYTNVRRTGGKLLRDVAAHIRTLAREHVSYRANMLFTFFVVALLGSSEHPTPDEQDLDSTPLMPESRHVPHLLRLLTPVLKVSTALAAVAGLRACMEALGGIGYLESDEPLFNIARLFRDTSVQSIWEGTTDVMAADVARVLTGKGAKAVHEALEAWVTRSVRRWQLADKVSADAAAKVQQRYETLIAFVRSSSDDALRYNGRKVLESLAWIVCAMVLVEDSLRDKDEVSSIIAQRWMDIDTNESGLVGIRINSWEDDARRDRMIVYNMSMLGDDVAKL